MTKLPGYGHSRHQGILNDAVNCYPQCSSDQRLLEQYIEQNYKKQLIAFNDAVLQFWEKRKKIRKE